MEEVIKFSTSESLMLIDIFSFPQKKDFYAFQLARYLKIAPTHPYFCKIIKYLKENEIMVFRQKIADTNLYELNKTKLRDLIDEQDIVNFIKDYMNDAGHICTW